MTMFIRNIKGWERAFVNDCGNFVGIEIEFVIIIYMMAFYKYKAIVIWYYMMAFLVIKFKIIANL